MKVNEFESTKERMLQLAFSLANRGLEKAIRFSRDRNDLKACVYQAHGAGARCFREAFGYILK